MVKLDSGRRAMTAVGLQQSAHVKSERAADVSTPPLMSASLSAQSYATDVDDALVSSAQSTVCQHTGPPSTSS